MTRYGDELYSGLDSIGSWLVENITLPESSPIPSVSARGKVMRYWRRYQLYPRHVRSYDKDVFHIVDQAYSYLVESAPPGRAIVTCHDLNLLTQREWDGSLPLKPRHWLFRWSIRRLSRAAHVIAVSESTRAEIIRFGLASSDRISVVPSGLSPAFTVSAQSTRQKVRNELSLCPNDFAVLHVGQDGSYKNFESVIRVVANLRRSSNSVKLLRVGKPLTSSSSSLIDELQLRPDFVDLGRLDDHHLATIYGASDCLLFPSLREGFGWPVVEAMACGCPVVTSEDPALLELNREVGLFAPAKDVKGLAVCLSTILNNPSTGQMISERGLIFSRAFSRKSTAKKVLEVYEAVLEDSKVSVARSL